MMDRILFSGKGLSLLKQALNVYAERSRVHARNVANADTPGYRAKEIQFEDDLRLALRGQSSRTVSQTNEKHLGLSANLPTGRLEYRNPTSEYAAGGLNDVEIDREMADIAANSLRYTVAAEKVAKTYEGIRKAIFGRPVG